MMEKCEITESGYPGSPKLRFTAPEFSRNFSKTSFPLVTQAARKKKIRVLPIEVEPMTFWLLVQMLYH